MDLLKVLDPTRCPARCFLPFLEQAPVGFCAQVESATQTPGMQGRRHGSFEHRLKDGGVEGIREAAFPPGPEGQWDLTGDAGQRSRSPSGSGTAGTGRR